MTTKTTTNTPAVFNFDNQEVRIINNDIYNPEFIAKIA